MSRGRPVRRRTRSAVRRSNGRGRPAGSGLGVSESGRGRGTGKEEGTDRRFRRVGLDPLLGARAAPRWPRARAHRRLQCGRCPCNLCLLIRTPTKRRAHPAPQGHTPRPRRPAQTRDSPARVARCTARRTLCRGGIRRRGTACGGDGASDGRCDGSRRASSQSPRCWVRSVRLWSGAGRRCVGIRARALGGPCRGRSRSCRSRARCRRRGCRTCVYVRARDVGHPDIID